MGSVRTRDYNKKNVICTLLTFPKIAGHCQKGLATSKFSPKCYVTEQASESCCYRIG